MVFRSYSSYCWIAAVASLFSSSCHSLVPPKQTTTTTSAAAAAAAPTQKNGPAPITTESFSVPLITERPKPKTFSDTLKQLWNDPRPVTSLISDALVVMDDNDSISKNNCENNNTMSKIPYCIVSDEFVIQQTHKFRILLYPRGRFAGGSSTTNTNIANAGPAAAYLRYIPNEYGDELDIGWKLRLVDTRQQQQQQQQQKALPIMTSGGLPRSNTTWSAAMTFCSSDWEDIESVGRVADWGSSSWFSSQVCNAIGHLEAQGEITVYASRTGESSFSWPPGGAIKAVLEAATTGTNAMKAANNNHQNRNVKTVERSFRVGEVIVPMENNNVDRDTQEKLEKSYIMPGTDYRIMTMSDKDGNPIFSTHNVPPEERKDVRLALRPCGWKTQQQMWQKRGMKADHWPVEVPAGWLSTNALSRFNLAAAVPRVSSTFQRDKTAVLLGIALALAPLPGALIGRNFVSLYAIPSASMEPTLLKGDVLLVEKFPGVLDRTERGDVILFSPPSALREIIGSSSISANSLFVKRIVGMPGDSSIQMLADGTNEVLVNGQPAVGPDRNLCDDEPLRLIDRMLETGKGKSIDVLGEDEAYVLGDCKAVSVDSRVFGVLPKDNIAGKPVGRIWPLSRFRIGSL